MNKIKISMQTQAIDYKIFSDNTKKIVSLSIIVDETKVKSSQ